jgi:DNA polymerase-3 subunit delta
MSATPTVYILHGDDEVGAKAFLAAMREKMGDPAAADMNTSRLEGRVNLAELKGAVSAVPFLVARRLVILANGLAHFKTKADQTKFSDLLEAIPPSTALVLVENTPLKEGHWILKWADAHPGEAYPKLLALPRGGALVRWIQGYARDRGGDVTPEAAFHLVSLIGDDNRSAANEVDKLLAYVNYARPVEVDDVELLTSPVQQGDVFEMVDAIGSRNAKAALKSLHNLLAHEDAFPLWGMIIRQFRLLLLYREMADAGATQPEIAKGLAVHPFVAQKVGAQARNFDLPTLEAIYRRLVVIDERIKTGQVDMEIALYTLVAGLAG